MPTLSGVPSADSPNATGLVAADYINLARHLELSQVSEGATMPPCLHPALAAQLPATAATLRHMASDPDSKANQSAYHTLKLFVP